MRKLHDQLCKHLLREALEPISTVELEKPVAPLDEQRIDVYCELRPELPPPEALPHLGLLRRMAELAQRFLIEPFSSTPALESVDDNLRKKFNLHHGLKKGAKGTLLPKPVLWVLSPGRPEEVLQGYGGAAIAGWPTGFYRCTPELATWIVVLAELPRTPETLLLRLLGSATMKLEALREFDAMELSPAERQPWIDILVDVRYLLDEAPDLSPEERTIMTELRQRWEREKAELRAEGKAQAMAEFRQRWEREKAELRAEGKAQAMAEFRQRWEREKAELRAEGRTEGRTEGKAEGKAEGILALLKARGLPVSEPVKARLLSCKDLSVLDRWLVRAATAASDTEVIAA